MIDFRYHIVSIVSIFLALAVGILLGAGPLQEDLGKTLSSQVSTLRQEKTDLRTRLDTSQQLVEASDAFVVEVTPELVGSRLGGRSVVVVVLPGADGDTVSALAKVLKASGAKVNGTLRVARAWTDPAKAGARGELTASLAPAGTGPTVAPADNLDAGMAALLAQALVVSRLTEADRATAASTHILAELKKADLVAFDGEALPPSTLAVVVAPAPKTDQPVDQRTADLSGWVALASALDAGSTGAAVVGSPDSSVVGGLIGAVRAGDAAKKQVSTVDDAAEPIGRVAIVYALREQMAGSAGHYGFGAGASAVLPALTASGS